MEIRPLYDRIIVKRVEQETRSKGGLFLPDSAREKPSEGIVMAIGHGHLQGDGELRGLAVKVGDRVLFGQYAGTEVKVGGQELLVMSESKIFGIVES